jgi:hypothetical protein
MRGRTMRIRFVYRDSPLFGPFTVQCKTCEFRIKYGRIWVDDVRRF